MSLRVITSLALVTLSGCDLDHQAGAAAIAELEGEFINTFLYYCVTVKAMQHSSRLYILQGREIGESLYSIFHILVLKTP